MLTSVPEISPVSQPVDGDTDVDHNVSDRRRDAEDRKLGRERTAQETGNAATCNREPDEKVRPVFAVCGGG